VKIRFDRELHPWVAVVAMGRRWRQTIAQDNISPAMDALYVRRRHG
jgi:hypothetical protein